MFEKRFIPITLILSLMLTQSALGADKTLYFTGSTACFVDSNMGSSYAYTQYCLQSSLTPQCSYGGFHYRAWAGNIIPEKAQVRLNASISGYGEAQFNLKSATVNGEQLAGGGSIRSYDLGSWGININSDDNIPDGTAYAKRVSGIYYHYKQTPIPFNKGGTWAGSGQVQLASVRWKGTSSVSTMTSAGLSSQVSVSYVPSVSQTVQLSGGGSETTTVNYEMRNFADSESPSGSGSWSVQGGLGCDKCKSTLRDDVHEHYTQCNGCLVTYQCYKYPGNHVWNEESCPSSATVNGVLINCTSGSDGYWNCSHQHEYNPSSGSDENTEDNSDNEDANGDGGSDGENPDNGVDSDDENANNDVGNNGDSTQNTVGERCRNPDCALLVTSQNSHEHQYVQCGSSSCNVNYWTCSVEADQHELRPCLRVNCRQRILKGSVQHYRRCTNPRNCFTIDGNTYPHSL